MGKHIIEFIGTFFLVFVIALTTNDPQMWAGGGTPLAPVAIGFTILASAYAGGPISGGAFNPVVGTGPTHVNTLLREEV